MAADVDHLNAVITAAEEHQRRMASALVTLEQRIVQLLSGAPLTDGKLFDLEWAIEARTQLRQIIQDEYLETVDEIVRDYAAIATQAETMLRTYSDVVRLDPGVVSQLQQLTFNGFEALGDDFAEVVSKQIYESTLTGATFSEGVERIRNLVEADLGRYASTALHDGLMDFDASINTNMALEAGAQRFKYYGPDDAKTREHCDKFVGKTLTLEEIERAWAGEWSGKREGSPFVVRGGYNCRHRFRGVFS
jgi:hypothetical protein